MDIKKVYRKLRRETRKRWLDVTKPRNYFLAGKELLNSYETAYADAVRRGDVRKITGDLEERSQRAFSSHARDYAFTKILEEGTYTFAHPYVAVNPYELAPLTALVLFCTDQECSVRFLIEGENGAAPVTAQTKLCKKHRVPVYGLYAGRRTEVKLELLDASGSVTDTKILKISTENLPENIETVLQEKNFQNPSAFPIIFITGGASLSPLAFDQNCQIRYLLKIKTSSYGVFPLKNGRLLWGDGEVGTPTFANAHTCQIHEMDYMGRIHRTIFLERGMHHFATELPNGNIVGISNSLDGCTEDVLIEIDRKTGKLVQTIDMREFFGTHYRDQVDWVHPNSLRYDEKEDTMMVCLRNVHSVLKFRWSTKEVLWVLSIPEFWEGLPLQDKVLRPVGEIRWNYQAHAAFEMPRREGQDPDVRSIMVFDNHRINRRPCDQFNESDSSFINVYGVNEKEGTVMMEKQFEIPKSLIRSNAVYDLATNRVFAMEGCLDRKKEEYRGRVLEMDYETGEVINSVCLKRDFFSGFCFEPDYAGLQDAAEYDGVYLSDNLEGPKETEMDSLPEKTLEEEVIKRILVREEYLYFKAKDHAVQKMFFIGEKGSYVKDYTHTWQTNHFHEDRVFFCVISLKDIRPDTYRLAIQYDGENYDLKKEFTIQ